jgi:hypothetical protein
MFLPRKWPQDRGSPRTRLLWITALDRILDLVLIQPLYLR